MDERSIKVTISRLETAFSNGTKRLGEEGGKKEYLRVLAKMDYERAKEAIDNLVDTKTYLPAISELWQAYRDIKSTTNEDYANNIFCFNCNDEGFIHEWRSTPGLNLPGQIPGMYEYYSRCNCHAGEKYSAWPMYDFDKNKPKEE